MNKKILKIAVKKFAKLKSRYKGFINVGIDNWRGYRFIFDTIDVRRCKNNCLKCPLYLLLKDKKRAFFSADLYLASDEDKKLFGPQNYLNCKTLKQYQDCYINFLTKKTKSEKEIKDELALIKNFRIIYSKESVDLEKLEATFRENILKNSSVESHFNKGKTIRKLWYTK